MPNSALGALLDVAGLVDHQHGLRVGQVLHDVVAQVIAYRVGVPHRAGQQMLHPVRAGFPGVLGDRPAVHPWQPGQQAEHERPRSPTRLHPGEP
jgi:hypothetical protein